MSTAVQFKLEAFRRWAREAHYGEVFVYHREPIDRDEQLFTYARKLHLAGLVFLFSRRLSDGRFEKCARRTPVRAHLALDKVSAAIQVAPSSAALLSKENAA
jgi:hypothetical protein